MIKSIQYTTFLYQYIAALGSFQAVIHAFGSDRILTALWLSLLSAFATAGLALVFGVPLAYFFAMEEFRGKAFVETLAVDGVPSKGGKSVTPLIFLVWSN